MVSTITSSPLAGGTKPSITPTTAKHLSRRPTLVRKRDETDLDRISEHLPSSPTKRARIAFNEDVEVKVMDDDGWDKRREIIREEVGRALQRHASGDSEGYEKLTQVYAAEGPSAELPSNKELKYHTAALLSNVALLNRSCSNLVRAVLRSDWVRRDDDYVSLFTKFLCNLISAQALWLASTLETLVDTFLTSMATNLYPRTHLNDVPSTQSHDESERIAAGYPCASQAPSAHCFASIVKTRAYW